MYTIPQQKSEKEEEDQSQNQQEQNEKKVQKQQEKNISIFDAVKKSLRCNEVDCKLILHCKPLTISKSLGELIYEESEKNKRYIILLIDLYDQEIQQIFNEISCIRSKHLLLGDRFMTQFKMKKLNDVVKQKRKQFYHCSGAYALSSQVFLKDLLRFQQIIDVNNISKIVFRIGQRINSYYNSIGWIATLLKIIKANIQIVYLCRQVQFYSQFQSLEALYRTIFCQKLVIWPFGRSEIHKKIKQIRNLTDQDLKKPQVFWVHKLKQQKSYLDMNQQQQKTAKILQNLVEIVQKSYNKSHPTARIKGMQLLYKQSIYRQLYHLNLFQNQINEFVNLRFLFIALCNCDSLMFLTILSGLKYDQQNMNANGSFMNSKTSIWNSNNSTVVELIAQLQKTVKRNVLSLRKINIIKEQQSHVHIKKNEQKLQQPNKQKTKTPSTKKIDLVQLIMNYHYDRVQNQLAQIYDNYQAIYQLQYQLDIHLSPNPKLQQIILILQKAKVDRQKQVQVLKNQLRDVKNNTTFVPLITKNHELKDALQLQIISDIQPQVLLINCPNEMSKKYLHRELFSYVHNCQYVQYLRALYKYLHIQRSYRIAKLKQIYTRIKKKKQYFYDSQPEQQEKKPKQDNSCQNIIQNQQLSNNSNNQVLMQKKQGQQIKVDIKVKELQQQCSKFLSLESKIEIQQCDGKKYTNQERFHQNQKIQKKSLEKQKQKQNKKKVNTNNTNMNTNTNMNGNLNNNKAKKIGWLQKMTQSQVILQECLYKQLQILMEIISHYQDKVMTDEQSRICYTQSKQPIYNKQKQMEKQERQRLNFLSNIFPFIQKQNSQKSQQYSASQKNPTISSSSSYGTYGSSTEHIQQKFIQEVKRNKFQFFDTDKLLIGPSYQSTTEYNIYSSSNKQQKLFIVSLFSPQKSSPNSDSVTKFSQMIKLTNPYKCIFYSPHPFQIRTLYILYSQKLLLRLKQIMVIAFIDSFEVEALKHQVNKQENSFWSIAKNKSNLSQYDQDPNIRIKKLEMNDKFQKTVDFMNYVMKKDESIPMRKFDMYRIDPGSRKIIVDTRQFKSALPCYLYFYGFTIIPIQLQTGDYILSQQIGIQKKSVQTKDLHLSLKSFRLDDQVKRMCKKFKRPYLLIQCQQNQNFKKQSFYERNTNNNNTTMEGQSNGNVKTKQKDSHRFWLRQRLAELTIKYPKLRIIWSNSVTTTCEHFKSLKYDNPEPQISKYLKSSKQDQSRNSNSISSIQQNQAQPQQSQENALQKIQIDA